MFCPKCGKELKPGARFCSGCGASAGQSLSESRNTEALAQASVNKSPKNKNIWTTGLLVLFLLLFLGAGVFAAYKQGMLDNLIASTTWGYDGSREREERREARDRKRQKEEEAKGVTTAAFTENTTAAAEEETTAAAATEAETTSAAMAAMETTASYYSSSGYPDYSAPAPNYYSYTPPPTTASSYTYGGYDSSYLIPNSSYSRLTEADLAGYTKEQLKIARNEIYARHGRRFDTEALQNYFNTKSWYSGTIAPSAFSEDLLSQVEKDNIKLIKKKEDSMP